MELYHYTSCENLQKILDSNQIKLTASNLLKPVKPQLINGTFADITDNYKPVVWFSSLLDFRKAVQAGLTIEKTEAAIQIELPPLQKFYKWTDWAEQNNIDKAWYKRLKETAPLWETFYITEYPIKITDKARIIFRPDIMANFKLS